MIKIFVICDRCHNEIKSEVDNIEELIDPLFVISAGGKTGSVCIDCQADFLRRKLDVEAYRKRVYEDFWVTPNA